MERGDAVFDEIAEFYDTTRREITSDEINVIVSALDSCKSVLEVGVGTGRIALPLQNKGFTVTGLDISVKMMEKAREKGIQHLVIGDATNLPFLDKFFDAFISVHVFHLLEKRELMMREAARVTKKVILSIIRESEDRTMPEKNGMRVVWKTYLEIREKYGYPTEVSEQRRGGLFESSILNIFPPYKKIFIRETEHRTGKWEFSGRFRHSSRYVRFSKDIPEDVHMKILKEVDDRISSMNLPERVSKSKEYLCIWRPEDILSAINM